MGPHPCHSFKSRPSPGIFYHAPPPLGPPLLIGLLDSPQSLILQAPPTFPSAPPLPGQRLSLPVQGLFLAHPGQESHQLQKRITAGWGTLDMRPLGLPGRCRSRDSLRRENITVRVAPVLSAPPPTPPPRAHREVPPPFCRLSRRNYAVTGTPRCVFPPRGTKSDPPASRSKSRRELCARANLV